MTTDSDDKLKTPGADATIQDLLRYANQSGYSGLSDAQIEQILQYRANVLAQQTMLKQVEEQLRSQHEQMMQLAAQQARDASAALESALTLHPTFEVVSTDEQTQA